MKKIGYIKLHRMILDNPISQNPKYLCLWITLLLMANHKECSFIWNGKVAKVNQGQILTGRKKLSKQTNIPETTIEDILNFLENEQQIRQQKTTKYRLITILNWNKYQITDNKATTKRQQSDTYKNVKNVKKKLSQDDNWNFLEELNLLRENKRKDYKIIALYWKSKNWRFDNKEQFNSALKRELKPAKSLTGYTGDQISKSIEYCDKKYPDIWTLETIHKTITNLINK